MIIVSLKVTLINGKNEEFCKLENYFEIDNSLNGLEQDDPVLIEAIKFRARLFLGIIRLVLRLKSIY